MVFPRTLSGGLEYRSNALVFKTFKAEEDAVKLSTKGRYAVMAMVDLARHAQTKPVSLSDIAARQEIRPFALIRGMPGYSTDGVPSGTNS